MFSTAEWSTRFILAGWSASKQTAVAQMNKIIVAVICGYFVLQNSTSPQYKYALANSGFILAIPSTVNLKKTPTDNSTFG